MRIHFKKKAEDTDSEYLSGRGTETTFIVNMSKIVMVVIVVKLCR